MLWYTLVNNTRCCGGAMLSEKNFKQIMESIINIERNDINNENANMSAFTPAGQMMKCASEMTKLYALEYLISPKFKQAHQNGEIHIHDLDFYPSKTTTCLQYDLEDLFENGFTTKHGFIREPKSISTYATLATIIFQTNQNEQHGGQSIPAFDFYMAKGVLKSFRRHFRYRLLSYLSKDYARSANNDIKSYVNTNINSIIETNETINNLSSFLKIENDTIEHLLKIAYEDTQLETHQALEGFIHNLNTMHSRGGNQVVFSSINYGTDTSEEGRMVIRELLKVTSEGLGKNETPIFPIQIFKVKEGLNFSETDYTNAMNNFQSAMNGEIKFDNRNFDLLLLACETSSKRLFPNFVFLDSPFNHHELWDINDGNRYKYEVATMGCRTRVFENINGDKTSLGRGNLSFTSINLPQLAIIAKQHVTSELQGKFDINSTETIDKLVATFQNMLIEKTNLVGEQLLERYNFQKTAYAMQFPFMSTNNLWKGLGSLASTDEVGDALNSGTLGIGFVGGSNAMYALFGYDHSVNKLAYQTLYDSIQLMNNVVSNLKDKYHLNFSILATPAESLAGRFAKIDQNKYGIIENVTDRDYYTNSFHIDVRNKISMFEKIKLEAPFHKITPGGHITYVELDGEAKKNVSVILKIVNEMKKQNVGYGSINHPVDRCKDCGFESIINDDCPICGSENISRIRRITGYLTGDLDSWNSAKKAEEKDRAKHSI